LSGGLIAILIFISINVCLDTYGVFGFKKNIQDLKTYNNEIVEKTYFSFHYVPKNYQALIVGSSLSANLDPSLGLEKFSLPLYNLSVRGMNLSLIKSMLYRVVEKGNIKLIVFSIDPYFTREKSETLVVPEDIYGALGSVSLLKRYFFEIMDKAGHKIYQSNHFGHINYNSNFTQDLANHNIKLGEIACAKGEYSPDFPLTQKMQKELTEVFNYLQARNIKVIAYYHPRMLYFRDYHKELITQYQSEMAQLFPKNVKVINFYDDKYKDFINNKSNYTDIGHFSQSGANSFFLNYLVPAMNEELSNL
jgi:hypothetical protein